MMWCDSRGEGNDVAEPMEYEGVESVELIDVCFRVAGRSFVSKS